MASLTLWPWVWVNFRSWWWTGRPGVLRFMGSQRVRNDWATELNWTEEETPGSFLSPPLHTHIKERPYLDDGNLQIRKRALTRIQACWHSDQISSLQNCEKIKFRCLRCSVCSILLQQPKLIKILPYVHTNLLGSRGQWFQDYVGLVIWRDFYLWETRLSLLTYQMIYRRIIKKKYHKFHKVLLWWI